MSDFVFLLSGSSGEDIRNADFPFSMEATCSPGLVIPVRENCSNWGNARVPRRHHSDYGLERLP